MIDYTAFYYSMYEYSMCLMLSLCDKCVVTFCDILCEN